MNISDQGRELLLEREGCRLEAYRDSEGVPTIGVGHTSGVSMGDTCTKEQALEWMAEDLRWVEGALNSKVTVPLEQHQYDGLGSFIFNVGAGAFESSTMLRLLNSGADVEMVAAQFDRWHIPPEIISRRNGEREQFKGTRFEARIE